MQDRVFVDFKLYQTCLTQILNQHLHDLIAIGVYFEFGLFVLGRPLYVDDMKRGGFFFRPETGVMSEHLETRAQADDKVRMLHGLASLLPIVRRAVPQLLAKVYDRVPQGKAVGGGRIAVSTAATARTAEATGHVLSERASLSHIKQPHVFHVAFSAEFDKAIAVQLGQFRALQAGSDVQTVTILTNHMLHQTRLHQAMKCHVGIGWCDSAEVRHVNFDSFLKLKMTSFI